MRSHSIFVVLVATSFQVMIDAWTWITPQQISSPKNPTDSHKFLSTRRTFVMGTVTSLPILVVSTMMGNANAYERRDVGGNDRSPETAAMNEMAYLTNNRLEKAGFQIETAAEQSASLTSALSDMSYDASSSPPKETKTKRAITKRSKTTTSNKNENMNK